MTIDFEYNSNSPFERQAYRTPVQGLVATLSGFEGTFPIINISGNGLSLKVCNFDNMRAGQEVTVEVMSVSKKKFISCTVQLVRVITSKEMICCEFTNLSKYQEESLDKLVLEVQKRELQRKKRLGGK